jgi:NAD(P)H-dependent FMN reductase
VIGASGGRFGGVWAHEDARKAVRAARAAVVEDVKYSIPDSLTRFAQIHPIDDPEVATELTSVLVRLAHAAGMAVEAVTAVRA